MSGLSDLVDAVRRRAGDAAPALVGVAGPVAVGKSRVAADLAAALATGELTVEVLGTDAYLHPNAVLAQRGIELRKGFPESFDEQALVRALDAIAAGRFPVLTPVYSHEIYDIVPGASREVRAADVVIVEGVNVLRPAVVDRLHAAVYVHASETDLRRWFGERLERLVDAARLDESSFYRRFVDLDAAAVRAFAEGVWDSINGPNLREHIAPTMHAAHIVVTKGPEHAIMDVRA